MDCAAVLAQLKRLFTGCDKRRCGRLDLADLSLCVAGWYREHDLRSTPAQARSQVSQALKQAGYPPDAALGFGQFLMLFGQRKERPGKLPFRVPKRCSRQLLHQVHEAGRAAVFAPQQVEEVVSELTRLIGDRAAIRRLQRHFEQAEVWKDTSAELHGASAEDVLTLVMIVLMKAEANPLSAALDRFVSAVIDGLAKPRPVRVDLVTVTGPLKEFMAVMLRVLQSLWPQLHRHQESTIEAVETVVLLHLYEPLLACFRAECANDEKKLAGLMAQQLSREQLQSLGVPTPLLERPELLSEAAEQLALFAHFQSPVRKAGCIGAACQHLAVAVEQARLMRSLGADEMLPCLAAAAAQCRVDDLAAQLRLVEWTLPEQVASVRSCQPAADSLSGVSRILCGSALGRRASAHLQARLAQQGPLSPRTEERANESRANQSAARSEDEEDEEAEDDLPLTEPAAGEAQSTRPRSAKWAVALPLNLAKPAAEPADAESAPLHGPRKVPSRNVMTGVPNALSPSSKRRRREEELQRVMGELHTRHRRPNRSSPNLLTPRAAAAAKYGQRKPAGAVARPGDAPTGAKREASGCKTCGFLQKCDLADAFAGTGGFKRKWCELHGDKLELFGESRTQLETVYTIIRLLASQSAVLTLLTKTGEVGACSECALADRCGQAATEQMVALKATSEEEMGQWRQWIEAGSRKGAAPADATRSEQRVGSQNAKAKQAAAVLLGALYGGWQRRHLAGALDPAVSTEEAIWREEAAGWATVLNQALASVQACTGMAEQAIASSQSPTPTPGSTDAAQAEAVLAVRQRDLAAVEARLAECEGEKQRLVDEMEQYLIQQSAQATATSLVQSVNYQLFAIRALDRALVKSCGSSSQARRLVAQWRARCLLSGRSVQAVLEQRVCEAVEQGEEAMEVAAAQMNLLAASEEQVERLVECCSAMGEWLIELCDSESTQMIGAVPEHVAECLGSAGVVLPPHAETLEYRYSQMLATLRGLVSRRPLLPTST